MNTLIPHAIDAAAARDPDRPAMLFVDESLTYAELAERSNALAHTLIEQGVRRRDRVGIYMDKCLETAVALHGIMKAGAAYVPLDPSAPTERIEGIVRDCDIRHLVSAPNKLRSLIRLAARATAIECVIGVDADADLPWRRVPWVDVAAANRDAMPDVGTIALDLAYIIYTSGSTGRPKGIMHTHNSGLSFAHWAAHEYELRTDDILSNHAPLHFDLSILDFFAGAVVGCTTSIIPEPHTKLPASYSQLIADHRITVLYTVPFAMVQLLQRGLLGERDLGALRWAIFGGEPFPMKHLRELMRALPHVRFDNIYGPAEVNGVTHYTVPPLRGDETAIPIGPLAASAEGLIVDLDDRPVARGEIGELLVRTPTMMQGYWNQEELNRRCFFRRETLPAFEDVFFRTGDLVEDPGDGILWFHGRKDRQVKIRGYRIELDEVEAALSAIDAIDECAAFVIPVDETSYEIRAAVIPKNGASIDEVSILKEMKQALPAYAIPSGIHVERQFPRTSTGKIDRRGLSETYLPADSGAVRKMEPNR